MKDRMLHRDPARCSEDLTQLNNWVRKKTVRWVNKWLTEAEDTVSGLKMGQSAISKIKHEGKKDARGTQMNVIHYVSVIIYVWPQKQFRKDNNQECSKCLDNYPEMQEIPQISGRIDTKETIPRPRGGGTAGDGDRRPIEQPEGSESHRLQKGDRDA